MTPTILPSLPVAIEAARDAIVAELGDVPEARLPHAARVREDMNLGEPEIEAVLAALNERFGADVDSASITTGMRLHQLAGLFSVPA